MSSSLRIPSALLLAVVCLSQLRLATGAVNIDGGRSQLPGMKQDMFDNAQREKASKGRAMGKGPPECPKSDKMSPFFGLAFVSGDIYVKTNSSDGKCHKLLTIGGANYTVLANASRTCGPAGEWKKRVAEELSAVFFQAGLDWVKHEGENIVVVTEEGQFDLPVNEARYAEMSACWARGCECEQAANPVGKAILIACLAIGVGGLMFDSFKFSSKKFFGEKPSKKVLCKKGHPMEETKASARHLCDVCGKSGTTYQCSNCPGPCPYDMCKPCYKASKKKLKTQLEDWYAKHPEDKAKDEEKKRLKKQKGEKDGSDDEMEGKDSTKGGTPADSEAEGGSGTKATSDSGKADSDKPDSGKDSEADGEDVAKE